MTTAAALIVVAGLSAGCASTGDVEDARQAAVRAQASADEAKALAQTAVATANEARTMAMESDSRVRRFEEGADRRFRRSMYK